MVRPRQTSDEEILAVARDCFMEKGLQVSTRTIAEKLGLSQPALFKRFKTKADLFIAALTPSEKMPVLDWIEQQPAEGPLLPQMETLLFKVWEQLKEIIPRVMVLHMAINNLSPDKLLSKFEVPPPTLILLAIGAFVKRAQQNGQISKALSPEALALNIMGTLQGRAFFNLVIKNPVPTETDEAYIKQTAQLLCRGIEPSENE